LLQALDKLAARIEPQHLEVALDSGMRFLDANHFVQTEDEEIAQFEEYYGIVMRELGVRASAEVIEELARAEVYGFGQEPYDDTRQALEELRRADVRLGIVSNAWPSLERAYRNLGLRDFFSAFVISSKLGCLKPDHRIYLAAIEAIGIAASEIIFVDDDPDYVRAADALGMRGVVMCRSGVGEIPVGAITNLAELWPMIRQQ
jgi:putative hydrolase of the HAD superfamily